MIRELIRKLLAMQMGLHLGKALAGKTMRDLPNKPGRILCFQMNAIGDAVMTQPAWWKLKSMFPEAGIDLVCRPHIAPLFAEDPSIDAVFSFENLKYRSWIFREAGRLEDLMEQRGYDLVLDFTALPLTAAVCAKQATPPSVGFERAMVSPLGRFDLGEAYDLTRPYSETAPIRALMGGLAEIYTEAGSPGPVPELCLSGAAMEQGRLLLKKKGLEEGRYIILHPGAKWPPKRWPAPYWRQLVEMIEAKLKLPVVLMGNRGDSALAGAILARLEKNKAHPCISEDLVLSAALIKMAALCVCNDSAAMHIAAAVGTKSIALFGPVSPDRSAPSLEEGCRVLYDHMFCSPCTLYYSRNRCRRGINFCMHAILPQTVYKEATRAIA